MRFFDNETRQAHKLFPSIELAAELEAHQSKFDCNHAAVELRRLHASGGTIQIRKQCLQCGAAVGNAVKKDVAKTITRDFDNNLASKFEQERISGQFAIYRMHLALQNAREASHQKEYAAYLASPQWAEKRQKVFKRANGLCEGCREQAAQDIPSDL